MTRRQWQAENRLFAVREIVNVQSITAVVNRERHGDAIAG